MIRIATCRWQDAGLFILPALAAGGSLSVTAPIGAALAWLLVGGCVSGVLSGMLGIGGALVTVPILYVALPGLGIAAENVPHVVVSSALLAMVTTTIAGAWAHYRAGKLDRAWLGRMAPGMAIGAVVGALLATQLRGLALTLAFAAQAMYYGCRLMTRRSGDGTPASSGLSRYVRGLPCWAVAPTMAAFCACVGMGGGSLVNPYLQSHGLDFRTSVATGSTLNLCIALGGSLAFWGGGAVSTASISPSWMAASLIGGAAVLVVPRGVALARRVRTTQLSFLVGAINVVAALSLLAHAV